MIIETTHRFTMKHQHRIQPGVMSEAHSHDWVWTVWLEGRPDPEYGWVMDFDEAREAMAKSIPTADVYQGTAEQLLGALVLELAWQLGSTAPVVVRARLEEKDGQAAIYIPTGSSA